MLQIILEINTFMWDLSGGPSSNLDCKTSRPFPRGTPPTADCYTRLFMQPPARLRVCREVGGQFWSLVGPGSGGVGAASELTARSRSSPAQMQLGWEGDGTCNLSC